MTYGSPVSGPIVPPAREGHRRRFNQADKHQILEEPVQAGANLSEVARRYGIAARVLFRWKQELTPSAAPVFVAVQITDANAPSDAALGNDERRDDAASSRREGAPGLRLYVDRTGRSSCRGAHRTGRLREQVGAPEYADLAAFQHILDVAVF
jgi:transposase-like protein